MDVSTILNWIGANHTALIAIGASALALSVGLETLLTHFKVESKKIAFSLLQLFTVASSAASYVLGSSGKQAAGTYAALTIVASFWHRFVVSDANKKYVTPFLTWLANQKAASATPATAAPTTPLVLDPSAPGFVPQK